MGGFLLGKPPRAGIPGVAGRLGAPAKNNSFFGRGLLFFFFARRKREIKFWVFFFAFRGCFVFWGGDFAFLGGVFVLFGCVFVFRASARIFWGVIF